jgi:hypothetical protein
MPTKYYHIMRRTPKTFLRRKLGRRNILGIAMAYPTI